MDISNQTLEQITKHLHDLVTHLHVEQPFAQSAKLAEVTAEDTKALEELLNLRGQLMDRFKAAFALVDLIEDKVKAKKFPAGTYGIVHQLKVTNVWNTEVNANLVIQTLKEKGLNPMDFMVLNTKDYYISKLVKDNPDFSNKVAGSNRHSFK